MEYQATDGAAAGLKGNGQAQWTAGMQSRASSWSASLAETANLILGECPSTSLLNIAQPTGVELSCSLRDIGAANVHSIGTLWPVFPSCFVHSISVCICFEPG